jgi:cytochrome c oxidase subunit 4
MTQHVDAIKTYAFCFVALIVLTLVTTFVAFVDLGPFNVIVALAIATIKMLLVALFFMHIRHSDRLTRLVVTGGLLWLAILLVLSFADFATRGWLGVPGR